mgnify:CR=1 FL=1
MVQGMDAKCRLRQRLRRGRRQLSADERQHQTAAIVEQVLARLQRAAPPIVASYCAAGGEVDLNALHRRWRAIGGQLCLPRVAGPGRLTWHRLDDEAELVTGTYGIAEPDPQRHPPTVLQPGSWVLVPGVGFTPGGERLGQGGGFYDRFLDRDFVAVGIAFTCQIVDRLPIEDHDRRCDALCAGGEWQWVSERGDPSASSG